MNIHLYQRAKMAFHNTEGKRNFPDRIPCLRCKKFKPNTLWLHPCSNRRNFCLKYGKRMCRAYEIAGITFEDAERWRVKHVEKQRSMIMSSSSGLRM